MSEENGKPQKYFAEIKTNNLGDKIVEAGSVTVFEYWACVTEACETSAKAKQELRSVAPKEAFSWRIIKVADSGRSKIETSVKLTSV